jgi:hypothetical protein
MVKEISERGDHLFNAMVGELESTRKWMEKVRRTRTGVRAGTTLPVEIIKVINHGYD